MSETPIVKDRRGVAAIEFALCVPLLLTMMAGISDLGLAMRCKMRLTSGIANAASYAVLTQGAASAATLAAIVQSTSRLTGVQASAAALACYCASGTPAKLTSATCGSTCANGASAGSYVSISANYNYTPLMPGYSFVANTKLTDQAWVQVK